MYMYKYKYKLINRPSEKSSANFCGWIGSRGRKDRDRDTSMRPATKSPRAAMSTARNIALAPGGRNFRCLFRSCFP